MVIVPRSPLCCNGNPLVLVARLLFRFQPWRTHRRFVVWVERIGRVCSSNSSASDCPGFGRRFREVMVSQKVCAEHEKYATALKAKFA